MSWAVLRFEKRYDWFKDAGDKEVLKETFGPCISKDMALRRRLRYPRP